jgi:hypothetical protein
MLTDAIIFSLLFPPPSLPLIGRLLHSVQLIYTVGFFCAAEYSVSACKHVSGSLCGDAIGRPYMSPRLLS